MMYLGDQAVGIATSLPVFSDTMKIDYGYYTPNEDISINNVSINHNLGEIPDFIFCHAITPFADDRSGWEKNYLMQFGASGWPSNAAIESYYNVGNNVVKPTGFESVLSSVLKSNIASTSLFKLYCGNSSLYLKANIKYFYIIGKFKEVTSNANE